MSFEDFLSTNRNALLEQYLRSAFAKPDTTLNDLFIALGDVAKNEEFSLEDYKLSDFVSPTTTTKKKPKSNTSTLQASIAFLKSRDEFCSAQDIAASTGFDVNYTRTKLLEEANKQDTRLVVTYDKSGPGRATPLFRYVKETTS